MKKLFKKDESKEALKQHIKMVDDEINVLTIEVSKEKDVDNRDKLLNQLDRLVKIRGDLATGLAMGVNKKELINGAFNIGTLLMILRYERLEVISSKAFSLVTKRFRG